MSVAALFPVCRVQRYQKQTFTCCRICGDKTLVVGTQNGYLLFYALDKPQVKSTRTQPFHNVDVQKFTTFEVIDRSNIIFLSSKDSVCKIYDIEQKRISETIEATLGTLFLTIGAVPMIQPPIPDHAYNQSQKDRFSIQKQHLNEANKITILVCAQENKKRGEKKMLVFYAWNGLTFMQYAETALPDGFLSGSTRSLRLIGSTLFVFTKRGYFLYNAQTGELYLNHHHTHSNELQEESYGLVSSCSLDQSDAVIISSPNTADRLELETGAELKEGIKLISVTKPSSSQSTSQAISSSPSPISYFPSLSSQSISKAQFSQTSPISSKFSNSNLQSPIQVQKKGKDNTIIKFTIKSDVMKGQSGVFEHLSHLANNWTKGQQLPIIDITQMYPFTVALRNTGKAGQGSGNSGYMEIALSYSDKPLQIITEEMLRSVYSDQTKYEKENNERETQTVKPFQQQLQISNKVQFRSFVTCNHAVFELVPVPIKLLMEQLDIAGDYKDALVALKTIDSKEFEPQFIEMELKEREKEKQQEKEKRKEKEIKKEKKRKKELQQEQQQQDIDNQQDRENEGDEDDEEDDEYNTEPIIIDASTFVYEVEGAGKKKKKINNEQNQQGQEIDNDIDEKDNINIKNYNNNINKNSKISYDELKEQQIEEEEDDTSYGRATKGVLFAAKSIIKQMRKNYVNESEKKKKELIQEIKEKAKKQIEALKEQLGYESLSSFQFEKAFAHFFQARLDPFFTIALFPLIIKNSMVLINLIPRPPIPRHSLQCTPNGEAYNRGKNCLISYLRLFRASFIRQKAAQFLSSRSIRNRIYQMTSIGNDDEDEILNKAGIDTISSALSESVEQQQHLSKQRMKKEEKTLKMGKKIRTPFDEIIIMLTRPQVQSPRQGIGNANQSVYTKDLFSFPYLTPRAPKQLEQIPPSPHLWLKMENELVKYSLKNVENLLSQPLSSFVCSDDLDLLCMIDTALLELTTGTTGGTSNSGNLNFISQTPSQQTSQQVNTEQQSTLINIPSSSSSSIPTNSVSPHLVPYHSSQIQSSQIQNEIAQTAPSKSILSQNEPKKLEPHHQISQQSSYASTSSYSLNPDRALATLINQPLFFADSDETILRLQMHNVALQLLRDREMALQGLKERMGERIPEDASLTPSQQLQQRTNAAKDVVNYLQMLGPENLSLIEAYAAPILADDQRIIDITYKDGIPGGDEYGNYDNEDEGRIQNKNKSIKDKQEQKWRKRAKKEIKKVKKRIIEEKQKLKQIKKQWENIKGKKTNADEINKNKDLSDKRENSDKIQQDEDSSVCSTSSDSQVLQTPQHLHSHTHIHSKQSISSQSQSSASSFLSSSLSSLETPSSTFKTSSSSPDFESTNDDNENENQMIEGVEEINEDENYDGNGKDEELEQQLFVEKLDVLNVGGNNEGKEESLYQINNKEVDEQLYLETMNKKTFKLDNRQKSSLSDMLSAQIIDQSDASLLQSEYISIIFSFFFLIEYNSTQSFVLQFFF
ncbi:MAG: hypothetical protein EZS28_008734 [Streblomastix strix]|uniref:Uncharacterized protein n=1 Tax=Streblomastix strix TaxID=222440 RepID=A0A5J4WNG7_9EUKA|nr:MAG: hypothetical protein EZS28_008734 [Streblomastix strix]